MFDWLLQRPYHHAVSGAIRLLHNIIDMRADVINQDCFSWEPYGGDNKELSPMTVGTACTILITEEHLRPYRKEIIRFHSARPTASLVRI